jgi:predicted HAD superfamily Cof-like phosphohydrolase
MTETPKPTSFEQVKEWNKKFEVPSFIDLPDAFARQKFWDLRMNLIREEFKELMDELLDAKNGDGSMLKIAKEAADLHYVIYGLEALLEIPANDTFAEVHRSNMSKLGTDGKPVRRSDGKVLKGPNYTEADLTKVFGVLLDK